MEVTVLYQSDNNYAPYLGVSLTSLLETSKETEAIHAIILDAGISEINKEKINNTCKRYGREVTFIDCQQIVEELEKKGYPKYRGSYATFLKLFALNRIPGEMKRVLYIDCDTVVSGGRKIEVLFDTELTPMGDKSIAMAQDLLGYQYKRKLGYSKDNLYCNAGVILVDMENWRNKGSVILEKFLVENKANEFRKHDQDILNLAFRDNIIQLGQEYNAQAILFSADAETIEAIYGKVFNYSRDQIVFYSKKYVICHFLQMLGEQPWFDSGIHPCTEIYRSFKEISEWKEERDISSKGKKTSWMIRIEKKMYRLFGRKMFLWLFKVAHDMTGAI